MTKLPPHKELEKIIQQLKIDSESTDFEKPTLLLHACCGPCSSYVIEYLAQYFDITIYYYNPNIHPSEEYFRRLNELKKFLTQFPDAIKNSVKLIEDSYIPEEYFSATKVQEETALQTEPEKGERCRRCYEFRMKRAYDFACKNKFKWFTTTLSISPHKDSKKIYEIGINLQKEYEETNKLDIANKNTAYTHFLPSDFKKNGGFLRSTQLSTEYGLWRQDYCGCIYSKQNRQTK